MKAIPHTGKSRKVTSQAMKQAEPDFSRSKVIICSKSHTGNAGNQPQVLLTLMPEPFATLAQVHEYFLQNFTEQDSRYLSWWLPNVAHRPQAEARSCVLDCRLPRENAGLVCPRNVPPHGRPGNSPFSSPHTPALHRSHLTTPQAPCSLSPPRAGPACAAGSGEKETKLEKEERGESNTTTLPPCY